MRITTTSSANFHRLFDLMDYQIERYPNATALNNVAQSKWKSCSINQLKTYVDTLSYWFHTQGFTKGEKIIFSPIMGTPEWVALDFACQQMGIIVVPIHPHLQPEEVEIILKETEARYGIVANRGLAQALKEVAEAIHQPFDIHHLEASMEGYFDFFGINPISISELAFVNARKSEIEEDDLATILYTSGSSGEPKGVMLTHGNIIHSIKALLTIVPVNPGQKVISFLPFSHILERVACYTYLAFGVSIYFSERKETFAQDFKYVKPYFCTAVPRVLEKMYDYLQEQMLSRSWTKRTLIKWAIRMGKQYTERNSLNIGYFIRLYLARIMVLYRWRNRLGGKIRYMVVGAATLRPEIGKLFSAAGIKIIEGYGMTEAAPLITINRFEPGLNKLGTAGLAIPGIGIQIEALTSEGEGEIMIKGPNVMSGYFKKEALNQEVFTSDGWFRTGDIGKFIDHHFLTITDRKKEIFKTSSGKYIAPMPLQNHLCQSSFIQNCLIIGFQRSFVTALIVPNFSVLESWCEQENIHWTSAQFMVHNIKVRAKLRNEINTLNEALPTFKQVRNFVVCPNDWSIEKGEITHTLKSVRHVLESNYKNEIEKMYK